MNFKIALLLLLAFSSIVITTAASFNIPKPALFPAKDSVLVDGAPPVQPQEPIDDPGFPH